jgi:Glycosyltransferase family 87
MTRVAESLRRQMTLPSGRRRVPLLWPKPDISRDGFLFLGLLMGILQAAGYLPLPYDSRAYFTADLGHLYPANWALAHYEGSGYLYPPPLAMALEPLRLLGWQAFQIAWTTLLFGAIWVMAGRWAWLVVAAGFVGAAVPAAHILSAPLGTALVGNVQVLIGASCVLAFRWPQVWALPLLTKIGPGIGILWHLVRREWAAAAAALSVSAVVAIASFLVAPNAWFAFAHFVLTNNLQDSPLPVVPISWPARLAMSAGLIAWAARRDARWALPLAVGWAVPALYIDSYWVVWLAAVRLSGLTSTAHATYLLPKLRRLQMVRPSAR